MSAWRRKGAALLPEHRWLIEHAESPSALWRQLYAIAVDLGSSSAADSNFLNRLFRYAKICWDSPTEATGSAVRREFYERLFDHEGARDHLQRLLAETEFRALEPSLSARFPPDQFAVLRAGFFRSLAEVEGTTTTGMVRRIKNEILADCTEGERHLVEAAWAQSLRLFEVGELQIGLETFLECLPEFSMPSAGEFEKRLGQLLPTLDPARSDEC